MKTIVIGKRMAGSTSAMPAPTKPWVSVPNVVYYMPALVENAAKKSVMNAAKRLSPAGAGAAHQVRAVSRTGSHLFTPIAKNMVKIALICPDLPNEVLWATMALHQNGKLI